MAKKSIEEKYITETALTKQVCIDAARHMLWHNWLFVPFIAIGCLLVLTLPVYLFYGCPLGVTLRTDIGFFPGVALLLTIAFLPRFLGKRLYKKNEGDSTVRMFFGSRDVNVINEKERQHFSYDMIKSFRQSDKYFFISTDNKGDALLYLIGKNCFIVGQADNFASFIEAKMEKGKRE